LIGERPMTRIDTALARKDFASMIKAVSKGERFILERHGKKVAAVVSIHDLAVLRALEDRLDRETADAALAEAEANGTIPWEEVKARLGL
jgi:antitoxin Phd